MKRAYSRLRGRIIEKYGTYTNFALAIGATGPTLSQRLRGKAMWRQDDILKCCRLLDIDQTEIGVYFFDEEHLKSKAI